MNNLREVYFVTTNKNKVLEMSRILGMLIRQKDLEIENEIQSLDVSIVARDKAVKAYQIVQSPVLVEDSGLSVDAYRDWPGALIKWNINSKKYRTMTPEQFCQIVPAKQRQAVAQSYFAIYDGSSFIIGSGRVKGEIAMEPRGRYGFGWDPIFIPAGQTKTFGEMVPMEKDKYSARSLAIADLKSHIR